MRFVLFVANFSYDERFVRELIFYFELHVKYEFIRIRRAPIKIKFISPHTVFYGLHNQRTEIAILIFLHF
jgi:hypothetical protein